MPYQSTALIIVVMSGCMVFLHRLAQDIYLQKSVAHHWVQTYKPLFNHNPYFQSLCLVVKSSVQPHRSHTVSVQLSRWISYQGWYCVGFDLILHLRIIMGKVLDILVYYAIDSFQLTSTCWTNVEKKDEKMIESLMLQIVTLFLLQIPRQDLKL